MPNYNRVLLMGNLTRDPELRYTPANTAVVSFGLAVNRRWQNQQGEPQEEVTFVDCEAWARAAETINQYMRKGRPLFVEGRLKLDQWQDKDGSKRSKLKVVVENFQFLDSRSTEGQGAGSASAEGAPAAPPRSGPARPVQGTTRAAAPSPAQPPPEAPHQAVGEGDIPF